MIGEIKMKEEVFFGEGMAKTKNDIPICTMPL